MEPTKRQEECVHALEVILSCVGLHGGGVSLKKDTKTSGSTQDNPSKICMGGEASPVKPFKIQKPHRVWHLEENLCRDHI